MKRTSILIFRVGHQQAAQGQRYSMGRMVGYDKKGYNFAAWSELMRLDAILARFASDGTRHE
ncbi:hypothetical protein ACSMEV_05565 [Pseudomonas sp. MLB6B]|uniref:hypothetical protein n=1 Tax=unclassified Pseudomonas TaxID=196821 RepID=UPI0025DB4A36|nr:hypothetical protein [Pseudomonas sp. UBA6562]